MKRIRDEEEEEQQQPAPMASSSPTSNQRPATAATPSGTVERPVMTWDDAVDFMLSVRDVFNDTAKYHEFLYVLSQRFSVGVRGTVDRMKVMLRGHPDLKRRVNMFLPAQYELSLSDSDDDQHEEAPATHNLQGRPAQRD